MTFEFRKEEKLKFQEWAFTVKIPLVAGRRDTGIFSTLVGGMNIIFLAIVTPQLGIHQQNENGKNAVVMTVVALVRPDISNSKTSK